MKYVVGFSGGIDSQAAARFVLNRHDPEDVVLLNSDAGGNEHPLTEEFIHGYGATVHPVVEIYPTFQDLFRSTDSDYDEAETPRARAKCDKRGYDPDARLTFVDLAKFKGRWPSRRAQFCTGILKLAPAVRWVEENLRGQPFVRVTGMRRGESHNRRNIPAQGHDDWFGCEVLHVIFDWSKSMCFDYVRAHEEAINPLYSLGFSRVGCAPCVNASREDIRHWVQRAHEMIDKVRAWEATTSRTFFAPMVPGKKINWIDEVVAWAMQVPRDRSRQFALDVLYTPSACESKYGLCE